MKDSTSVSWNSFFKLLLSRFLFLCVTSEVVVHVASGAGNCSSWPPPCSQLCNGTPVIARCSCETGYYLAADERHCHANQSTSSFQPTGRSAFLLYNSGVDIVAVPFDSVLSASSSSSSSTSSPADLTPTTIYEGTPGIEIVNFAMGKTGAIIRPKYFTNY